MQGFLLNRLAGENLLDKLRVLVADNSVFYKKIFSLAVKETGLGSVLHTASSGALALERLGQQSTDVVLLDLHIPDSGGIKTLEAILREHPGIFVAILHPAGNNDAAGCTRAMEIGAVDCILKPPVAEAEKSLSNLKIHLQGFFTQIITMKFTMPPIAKVNTVQTSQISSSKPPEWKAAEAPPKTVDLVVIAASTGGPEALEAVLSRLTADFNRPVLVIQHMPADITRKLAQSLDRKCSLPVLEAEEGMPVKPGQILIAPGGRHMSVHCVSPAGMVIKLDDSGPVNGVKPSADVLFRSIASSCKGLRVAAVILTGMGRDGTAGLKEMKNNCRSYCLVQSERTCTVYGMPKAVVDAGLADTVEDLEVIADHLLRIVPVRSL